MKYSVILFASKVVCHILEVFSWDVPGISCFGRGVSSRLMCALLVHGWKMLWRWKKHHVCSKEQERQYPLRCVHQTSDTFKQNRLRRLYLVILHGEMLLRAWGKGGKVCLKSHFTVRCGTRRIIGEKDSKTSPRHVFEHLTCTDIMQKTFFPRWLNTHSPHSPNAHAFLPWSLLLLQRHKRTRWTHKWR